MGGALLLGPLQRRRSDRSRREPITFDERRKGGEDFGNGDGLLAYPGPLPSLRLKACGVDPRPAALARARKVRRKGSRARSRGARLPERWAKPGPNRVGPRAKRRSSAPAAKSCSESRSIVVATADFADLEPGLQAGISLAWHTLVVGSRTQWPPGRHCAGRARRQRRFGDHAARLRACLRAARQRGNREPGTLPRPRAARVRDRRLFTSEPLFRVMATHKLYPGSIKRHPRGALQSFREDIEVEVYGNYFLEERAPTDRPRTARIAVSYRSTKPDLALESRGSSAHS